MEFNLLEKINSYGVGRRKLDDNLFKDDKPPPRLGVYNFDEESLCHEVPHKFQCCTRGLFFIETEIVLQYCACQTCWHMVLYRACFLCIKSTCHVPGCTFAAESLLEYENHYNSCHRYACSQCKKNLPSPHLLDLHIQETHDSFFAVLAERKPSYCCYIEECREKFNNSEERLQHCIKDHKLPKDFRFESKPKSRNKKTKDNTIKKKNEESMEVDDENKKETKKKITLSNSKQKTFAKYTGKKFIDSKTENIPTSVNINKVIADLKDSLPK